MKLIEALTRRWRVIRMHHREDDGAVIVMVAICMMPVVLGAAAIGIDTANWYWLSNRVQLAADAAALAGSVYMPDNATKADTEAKAAAARNGFVHGENTVRVTSANGTKTSQLRVTVQKTVPNFFGYLLGRPQQTIVRTAVGEYKGPVLMGSPCNTFGNVPSAGTDSATTSGVSLNGAPAVTNKVKAKANEKAAAKAPAAKANSLRGGGAVTNALTARTPAFGSATSTSTGFTVNITNYSSLWTWPTPTGTNGAIVTKGTASGSNLPLTITGLNYGDSSTLTATATRSGYDPGSATFTASASLGPARTPSFSAPAQTATGYTVNITNYSTSWTWPTPTATAGTVTVGTASGATLPLTVSGLSPGSSSTITATTTRTDYQSGSASVTNAALNSARTPTFGPETQTATGFTVTITNYSSSWTWPAITASNGATVTRGTISGSNLPLTITGLAPGASTTITSTTTRSGYASGSATFTASALMGAARTPTFDTPVAVDGGFTVNVTNYSSSWTWPTPAATNGASVTKGTPSGTTLPLTITGLDPIQSSTITVTATRTGYISGSATISGTADYGAALTAAFDSPVATSSGFTVNITNYNSSWTWPNPTITNGTVTVGTLSGTTLPLTVMGLNPAQGATITVTTTRSNYYDGTSTVYGAAQSSAAVSGCSLTPQLWGNVAGPGSPKSNGDMYSTRTCAAGNSGCTSNVNTDYNPLGYFYKISVTAAVSSMDVQIFDPTLINVGDHCDSLLPATWTVDKPNQYSTVSGDAANRYKSGDGGFCTGDVMFSGNASSSITTYSVRSPITAQNPLAAPLVSGCTKQFTGINVSNSAAMAKALDSKNYTTAQGYSDAVSKVFRQWSTLCTISNPTIGDYYLQVRTNLPSGTTSLAALNSRTEYPTVNWSGHNRYSLRASVTGSSANVQIAGYGQMSIYANNPATNATFYLSRIGSGSAGRSLDITLYDAGDAAQAGTITIIPPTESMNASAALNLNSCQAVGDVVGTNAVPVAMGTNCRLSNVYSGTYNGKKQIIRVPLPTGYTCADDDPAGCWFKINFQFPGGAQDTTTWSTDLNGQPVRLVE